MSSFIVGLEIISEHISLVNGTLCQHGYAVHILRSALEHPVPVDGQLASKDVVLKVNDNTVPQTYLCNAEPNFSFHKTKKENLGTVPCIIVHSSVNTSRSLYLLDSLGFVVL